MLLVSVGFLLLLGIGGFYVLREERRAEEERLEQEAEAAAEEQAQQEILIAEGEARDLLLMEMLEAFERADHRNALLHRRIANLLLRLGRRAGIDVDEVNGGTIFRPPFNARFGSGGGSGGGGSGGGGGGGPPPAPELPPAPPPCEAAGNSSQCPPGLNGGGKPNG